MIDAIVDVPVPELIARMMVSYEPTTQLLTTVGDSLHT